MATNKKKKPVKQGKGATSSKRPAPKRAKKPAAPKRKAPVRKPTPRKAAGKVPPMHAKVRHPELDEVAGSSRDEVFEIFRTYDRDASGSIDRGELARLLEALGMEVSDEELAIALDAVDANHSGRISWDEFKAWWASR
jgi:hypothetical protein